MQVHALVVFGPAPNIIARLRWFSSIKYLIGGQEYSANDIEHGVLRNNKPSPANLLSLVGFSSIAPKTFQPGDPRLSQVMFDSASSAPARHVQHATGETLSMQAPSELHMPVWRLNMRGAISKLQAVDPEDPRIHFALVCGAKSCPPIKVNSLLSTYAAPKIAAPGMPHSNTAGQAAFVAFVCGRLSGSVTFFTLLDLTQRLC